MPEVTVLSLTLTLAALTLSGAVTARAQIAPPASPAPAPVLLTVSVGQGKTWDDESEIGKGTSAGGGVEWRFRPKWSVGAEVERLGHHRSTPGLEWSGRTVFASVNIAYRFAARGVSPYVGGGFGGAFHTGETIDRITPAAVTRQRSSASTMEYGTVGLEIPVGGWFAVSPDFRITFCQAPDDFAPWAALRFAVKASVRF
jgi:hypothetical protein